MISPELSISSFDSTFASLIKLSCTTGLSIGDCEGATDGEVDGEYEGLRVGGAEGLWDGANVGAVLDKQVPMYNLMRVGNNLYHGR